jgi:hypothetical protein
MDTTMMLQTALILFTVAALGGLAMAGIRFIGGHNPPAWLSMLHGLLAAAGLTLLIYAGYTGEVPMLARVSGGLLLLAAIGGAYLNLGFQQKQRLLPVTIVVGHAVLAVVGFLCLAVAVLRG